jgi:hypothetical protein
MDADTLLIGDERPTGAAPSQPPCHSEACPLLQTPPDVAALLSAQSSGSVVSPVLAHNSPLVPWELPSEIGYFWLGLFRISAVKVMSMSAIPSEFFRFMASSVFG